LKKRTKKPFPAPRDAWSVGDGGRPHSKPRGAFKSFLLLFCKKEALPFP
jgi:hypothetical protein